VDLQDRARYWNVTALERAAHYPCDHLLPAAQDRQDFLRAIDVDAPAEVAFRWLCQLKVAPYSYDWIDNGSRRSPRQLTPGAEQLAVGQPFLVFSVTNFEPGRHLTGLIRSPFDRIFGRIAGTYQVTPTGPASSRLVMRLVVAANGRCDGLRRTLLAWGDLVMARKQLRTLKALAERQAAAESASSGRSRPGTG
jgi:hypothetical protein